MRPGDHLTISPTADGGEGTLAAVTAAHPGPPLHRVGGRTGPDGRPVDGTYALLPDGSRGRARRRRRSAAEVTAPRSARRHRPRSR
ncbi:glycerate kinase [Streptomyces sp. NPDC053513]|uniref:glycerate kinase n=1 Tax=unclassified Streptomyces TaxID=2593676 RepID=UPI0037D33030